MKRSSELNSCWQFASDSNITSSINNIYHSKLTSNPLFNSVSTAETNIVRCFENEQMNVLLATSIVVLSTKNDTAAVTTFYTNSLNDIKTLYLQYELIYTHQNTKIEVYDYNPSSTSAFNASNVYTTSYDIPSLSSSLILPWEVWKSQWWEEWHSWKIFGVAAFAVAALALTCLICCVICYKCCCCQSTHANKHKMLPTQDTDDENEENDDNEKKVDKDDAKLYKKVLPAPEIQIVSSTNIIEDITSHNKQNNYDPIPPTDNDDSQTDSDIEALYDKPNKNPTTILTFLSNNQPNANDRNISEAKENVQMYLETDSNRARNDSMSVPPIPGDGDSMSASPDVSCEEENNYNELVSGQESPVHDAENPKQINSNICENKELLSEATVTQVSVEKDQITSAHTEVTEQTMTTPTEYISYPCSHISNTNDLIAITEEKG